MMAKICHACLFLHHASQCDEVLSVLHLQILSGKIIPCHVCHGYCVTLLSLFQIPASLTCSKLCGVQGGAGQDHLEGQVHQGQHHHSGLHHQAEDGGD